MTYADPNVRLPRRRSGGTHHVMNECADPAHRAVARMVGYALTLGDIDTWAETALVLLARLTPQERALLAWSVLHSLDARDADKVARRHLLGAGMPAPTFDEAKDEAALWAAAAAPRELRAYAGAAFKAMSREDRAAFLEWARRAR